LDQRSGIRSGLDALRFNEQLIHDGLAAIHDEGLHGQTESQRQQHVERRYEESVHGQNEDDNAHGPFNGKSDDPDNRRSAIARDGK
jgi:hypothetical protein